MRTMMATSLPTHVPVEQGRLIFFTHRFREAAAIRRVLAIRFAVMHGRLSALGRTRLVVSGSPTGQHLSVPPYEDRAIQAKSGGGPRL
jgi:hypothetical protein